MVDTACMTTGEAMEDTGIEDSRCNKIDVLILLKKLETSSVEIQRTLSYYISIRRRRFVPLSSVKIIAEGL